MSIEDLPDWVNALGLLLSNLPEVYSDGLTQRLVSALSSPPLSQWNLPQNIFDLLNFEAITGIKGGTTPNSRLNTHIMAFCMVSGIWKPTI
jgi:hypothetical protein